MGRLARWRALLAIGVRRTVVRLRHDGQSALSVAGIAIAVGLLLTVTSIGVGIATGGVAADTGADYVITPAGGSSSVVADVERQQLGDVHRATARIEAMDGVRWATPVLVTIGTVTVDGARERLLVIGVIPDTGVQVAGLSTEALTTGDPAAEGAARTGEAVISETAADEFGYAAGTRFGLENGAADANRTFTVVGVEAPSEPGAGQLPVAVVHLRELQSITGGADSDVAGQLLVSGSGRDLQTRLGGVYPSAEVQTQSGLFRQQVLDSQLTLAVGVGAVLVTTIIGVLFIATTMGFTLAGEQSEARVLRAMGLSRRSRALLLVVRTLVVCLLGGLAGLGLWLVGASLVNVAARTISGGTAIARLHPALVAVGLATALGIGLLTLPYLLVVQGRHDEVVP